MMRYRYFAQPIENISTQRVIAYELLLREWQPEQQQWQRPGCFEIDATTTITLLREALSHLKTKRVSVNLTKQQFLDPAMAQAIADFAKVELLPRQLTVELMDCPSLADVKRMGVPYREAGVLLAIDDVGSDHSYERIATLLPYVNTIKFALQNLRQQGQRTSEAMIESLHFWFDQAEAQQMLFTFEGIENQADVDLASHVGVTRGQGYFLSQPQEPAAFQS